MDNYVRHYGSNDMKCQDCKYYKPINDNEGKCKSPMDAYYGLDSTVVGDLGKCDYFKPTDNSVGNALDALDSWESVSK